MKIGLITHYMPPHTGGIERVAETLFDAYTERGFAVRWVASRDPLGTAPREGDRIRVPCWNVLERRLSVPLPLWGPSAWREVSRLVAWADALHVHDCLYPGSVLAVALGRSQGKPALLSQHVGFVSYRLAVLRALERAAYRTLGRWVLRRAGRLAFATPAAEAYVSELLGGCPPNACAVPNGIDTERFHPASPDERHAARSALGLTGDGPVVLFVGRLVEKKGIDLVVAVSRLLPDARFLIVGDGPLAGILPAAANITWRRALRPDAMPACYHAADCFLLPSHGEGLPVAVQEAAACGLPTIVSEGEIYAGPLAGHGVCVTAPREAGAMAAAVRVMLGEPTPEQSARARHYAKSHWSLSAMVDRYLALLEQTAAERRKGPDPASGGIPAVPHRTEKTGP